MPPPYPQTAWAEDLVLAARECKASGEALGIAGSPLGERQSRLGVGPCPRRRRRPCAGALRLPARHGRPPAHRPSHAVPPPHACAAAGGLLDALERDVYSAAERCWRLEDKVVTLRGGAAAVVTLRAKAVCVQVRRQRKCPTAAANALSHRESPIHAQQSVPVPPCTACLQLFRQLPSSARLPTPAPLISPS